MALSKKHRISDKKDIERMFKGGRTVRSSSLFIKFIKNHKEYTRIVFMVPAKHVSLAVNRNKIRRMFSEEIMKGSLLTEKGYDMIISIHKKTKKEQYGLLKEELRSLLDKIK